MKVLDLDMDYFMYEIATDIPENKSERLSEDDYGHSIWSEKEINDFLQNNLGLSVNIKIKGRIVSGHNEALLFWQELIENKLLTAPFEILHIDSHADLGVGYSSWKYILDTLIKYPVEERMKHNMYRDCYGNIKAEGIGDYLLFAIAYRWVSKLTYCANPNGDKNDYIVDIMKNFHEECIWDKPVKNTIQFAYNLKMPRPDCNDSDELKEIFFETAQKEPAIPMIIIPTIQDVQYNGDFDYISMAQSPNYTPASADFIMDIFKNYIEEI